MSLKLAGKVFNLSIPNSYTSYFKLDKSTFLQMKIYKPVNLY